MRLAPGRVRTPDTVGFYGLHHAASPNYAPINHSYSQIRHTINQNGDCCDCVHHRNTIGDVERRGERTLSDGNEIDASDGPLNVESYACIHTCVV